MESTRSLQIDQLCRVLVGGAKNSILIEFKEAGFKVVTSGMLCGQWWRPGG